MVVPDTSICHSAVLEKEEEERRGRYIHNTFR